MQVLVLNCGSSTLKFDFFEVLGGVEGQVNSLASGLVDRIGREGRLSFTAHNGQTLDQPAKVPDHDQATRQVLGWLDSAGVAGSKGIEAVGHRVVHGGAHFREPAIIDNLVLKGIKEVTQLAPLHNGPSLEAIKAVSDALRTSIPAVAVFDTAFHRTLPRMASSYAIPKDLAEKHQIQRYGFHGIAHRYMAERYGEIVGKPVTELKLITLQLGNGCSAAAVGSGHSVDTSMGLTPLEGLIMGTRSGDIDPALPGFLSRHENVPVDEVEDWLNHRSGLLGVSGRSQDMRELLNAESTGDAESSLAIDMFCYRVRKYIGAYLAVLGGADAVVFGGGIGENAPMVRERICAGMDWCGLALDARRNAETVGKEARIAADTARIDTYVIPVDEAAVILRETIRCLDSQSNI